MRATAETIWQVPAYLPYVQPALTDEAVAAAEAKIGYRLPSEYLELLRVQNGGYIRFGLPEHLHDKISGIGPHFPSLTDFDWEETQQYVSYPLQGLVPFDGDGHWHMCLDYRKDPAAPVITYADVEYETEEQIAGSFQEYLSLLRLAVGDEYVVERVADIEGLKAELSRALGAVFEQTDAEAAGYRTEWARLGRVRDKLLLWISPNTVQRGFVPAEDRRYEELRGMMRGTADRFPGLPAGSFILTTTEGARERVLEACTKVGLVVRPLGEYYAGS